MKLSVGEMAIWAAAFVGSMRSSYEHTSGRRSYIADDTGALTVPNYVTMAVEEAWDMVWYARQAVPHVIEGFGEDDDNCGRVTGAIRAMVYTDVPKRKGKNEQET